MDSRLRRGRLAAICNHVTPASPSPAAAEVVAFCTHEGAAHVTAYLAGLRDTAAVSSVALSDPTGFWAGQAKEILGDKLHSVHADAAKMLQELQPPIAIITMEAILTPPVVEAALNAGCHVLAEKPGCVDLVAFDKLLRLSKQRGRNLSLAFANRVRPEIARAAELVASGVVGKVYAVEIHTVADQKRLQNPAYHSRWEAIASRSGGGHLAWLGVHFIDIANFVLGSKPCQVCGMTANVGGQPLDTEDAAAATMRYENGALGTIMR
jgi:predicted dehydrogenase